MLGFNFYLQFVGNRKFHLKNVQRKGKKIAIIGANTTKNKYVKSGEKK